MVIATVSSKHLQQQPLKPSSRSNQILIADLMKTCGLKTKVKVDVFSTSIGLGSERKKTIKDSPKLSCSGSSSASSTCDCKSLESNPKSSEVCCFTNAAGSVGGAGGGVTVAEAGG